MVIAFREIEDPSRFGVVELIGNRSNRLVEKPRREEAPSNLITADVYVLNQSVYDLILKGKKMSMEREIFPVMLPIIYRREGLDQLLFKGLVTWRLLVFRTKNCFNG